jgi:nucleoside phosphorylase
MNTNLLFSKPTNRKPTFLLKSFLFMLPFLFGSLSEANAQCIGPYQYFESIPSNALVSNQSAGLNANGWTHSLTSLSTATASAYSGRYAVSMNATTRFIQTPVIASPGSFSFYYKPTQTLWGFKVEYSTDINFVSPAPVNIGNYSGPSASATYIYSTIDLVAAGVPANAYVRITPTLARTIFFDDLAVTSATASQNTIIVPMTSSAANCNFNLVSGMTYTFYDNGGSSDSFSPSQNNNMTFVPAAGEQVELTFTAFNATTGTITLTNTTPTLTHTGAALPGVTYYLGTAANVNVGVGFVTTSSIAPTAGYTITVRCIPPVATCSDPTSPSVPAGNVQATTANVNFTPPGSAPSNGYEYYYSTSATTPPAGSLATPSGSGASSPMAMTGLSPNTTYYVWIRSYCGGTLYGNWVPVAATFTTKCSAYPVTYTEDFNGLNGPIPTCTSYDSGGVWATNITNGNLFTPDEGGTFFTKPVALTAGTVYRLSFDYGTINGIADFDVNYGRTNFTPSTTNINVLLNMYSGVSTLSTGVYNFTPGITGTYYAGFTLQAVGNPGSTQFNLDNITIEAETCFPPTALTASAVTAFTATVSWTPPVSPPANGYQYYISTSNVAPEYSTTPTGTVAAGTSVNLTGLTSGTTYYIWVRSNCSGRYSVWSVSGTFTTVTIVVTTVNMTNGSTTGCNTYNFFDSGGSAAAYVDFEDLTYTFTPLAGKKMKVVFSSFSTESGWDGLRIYDGNSTGAPMISSGLAGGFNLTTCPAGSYYGTTSPGTIISTAADGSLTFRFTSDFIITRPGWSATVTCVTAPVITSFTPGNNSCVSGTVVTITGSNFSGAGVPAVTGVFFNGIAASSYTVNSATQITATLPAGFTTGLISVTNTEATGYSATAFNTYLPAPTTTGVTICAGGSGTLSTSSICTGFNQNAPTITGNLNGATDPIAPRPQTSTSNSTICGFAVPTSNYTAVQFQVSVTGLYNFEMSATPAFDGMGYITTGAFTAGSCATGTYMIGDDDSGVGTFPLMSVNLTQGVTYTLYTTVWSGSSTTYTGPYTWTVTSPGGGSALLFSNAQMEWYTVATGGTAIGTGSPFNPVGVAGSGLPNTNTAGTYNFYAGCSSNPNCRTLTTYVINPIAVAGTVSANQTICSGNSPANITLTGSTGSIQWQSSPDNATWSNIVGATATPLTSAQMGTLTAVKYYRAVVTTPCSTLNSGVVTVNVNPVTVAGTITPASTTVCTGTNSTLLTLAGNTGTIQWQSSPDNATWGNIGGATTATYTATNLVATTYYRAVITSGVCSSANTASVVVTVSPAVVAGSVTPASTAVCSGTNSTLLTLAGNTGTIQWQSSPDNATWGNIGGATTATYTATNLVATTYYRAVVTSGACGSLNTASVVVTVSPVSVAGSITPASTSVCTGTNSTLLTLTGNTGTIQWQSSPNNVAWSNIGGATTSTYTATNLLATTYYRTVITSGSCAPVNTASVVITVSPAVVAGSITPTTTTVCAGTNSTLLTLAGNTGTIQWQSSPDNATWGNIGGATTATFTATNLVATTYYRAVVTSGACGSLNTTSVVVTVNPASVAGTAASSQIICPGNTPANMTLTGNTGTIQWQSSPNNVAWSNIGGATAATLTGATVGPLASTTYFRAVVTSGICAPVNSASITITVTAAVGGTTSPASQSTCTTISNLTIAGYVGTITGWEWATTVGFAVPNTIPASASPTLTAAQIGTFSGTRYYRAVITSGSCTAYSSTADITYNSTTWNGAAWSNGAPTSTTAAIFTGNYTAAANFSACSIHILSGANVTVNPGIVMTIQNAVTVDSGGTLTFENTSSLLQVSDAAVNSGYVTYKRTTTPMHMYDYTYWSSPLFPQTLFGVSPLTLSDKYFAFNTASNTYQQLSSSNLMAPGKGYIIRAPQGWPVSPAAGATFTAIFNGGSGDGVPNNGVINLPVVVSGGNVMNLMGNPYASALNADAFLTANSAIMDGTIYLWTHNTAINANQYTGSDYAVYNLGAGVGTSAATNPGINMQVPNGSIGAGQGFFVKGINSGGNALYNNSMRSGNNTQFYRPAAISHATPGNLEKSRVWLELKNDQGAYKQIAVGYIETATNGRDWGFDSDMVDAGNAVGLYSVSGTDKFSIQSRALPFDLNDQVPLGYKANFAGTYEINLPVYDGLFTTQDIYLEDKLLNVIHNLKSGSYSFATPAGTFDERFLLRFTSGSALGVGNHVFDENSVVVYRNDTGININTTNVIMASVKIFDIRGRLIAEKDNINASTYRFTHLPETQQVLLVKITSEDGSVVNKKVVY